MSRASDAAGARRRPYAQRLPDSVRRDQLLDAALRIVARDGYRGISVESVAREVGVTRPVVYRIFAGLDELLAALLDRQTERAVGQLLSVMTAAPRRGHVRDWLRSTVLAMIEIVSTDPLTWTPIFLSTSDAPAAVRRRRASEREVVRLRIRDIITEVRTDHGAAERDAAADSDVLAHSLIALGEYFGALAVSAPESLDAERVADTLAALFAPSVRRTQPA